MRGFVLFSVDKNLNYGRDIIEYFASTLQGINSCLDIGAGEGNDLLLVKKSHPQVKLSAVESWEPNVQKLLSLGVEVKPLNFEEASLPFPDQSFDLILSNQVFEHTKELFWVMHEVSRTLKIGGHLLVGIPNLASFHNRLLLLIGRQPTCIQNHSAHIRGFTTPDLLNFINIFENGYKLKKYRGSNFYPFSPIIAKPLAKIFPSMAWSNFVLLQKIRDYQESEYLRFPLEQRLETNFRTICHL